MCRIALALVLLCAATSPASAEPLRRVRLNAADPVSVAEQLRGAGLDVLDGSITADTLDVIVSATDLQTLLDLGYKPELIAVGRPFRDIQAEMDALPPGYADLAGLIAEMNARAAAYPAICTVVDLTATYGTPATVGGRHLYAAKVSDNVNLDEDEPAILIVGNFHAREVVTPVIALYALQQFTTQYGGDPTITSLVDNYEIWIAPTFNPDGYDYVYNTDNMWRKNRRVFTGGVGVDLNRNFPIGWNGSTSCTGDTSPSSETYKGPSAASEAETQTMIAWSQDRRFARVIDYHSYGREVVRGYLCLTHPFSAYLTTEAAALATASGYAGANRAPSADGEHYEWQLAYMGAAANLIETATDFQPSFAAAQAEAATVWPGILWAMQRPVPLWGYVIDAATAAPVTNASITLVGAGFANGEVFPSGRFGRYQAFIPPGTYQLSVTAPGYEPTTINNVVVSSGSTRLDISPGMPPALTHPNGGEQLPINVPTTITWTGAAPAWRYHVQATYNADQIGPITDSFERTQLGSDYQVGGNLPWTISASVALMGTRSARAGAITHNQTSYMARTASAGTFSFWYYVSSEANGDYFNFYIDDTQILHVSGTTAWVQYSTTLSAGQHVVKWEYVKNATGSAGNDSVWIDWIQMTADTTPWVDVIAQTLPGASSAAWTPTTLSTNCKVRVRSDHQDGTYGPWVQSAAPFTVTNVVVYAGDLNCDGVVNVNDVAPFVLALTDPDAYVAQYPSCAIGRADLNNDAATDGRDIQPFVNAVLDR